METAHRRVGSQYQIRCILRKRGRWTMIHVDDSDIQLRTYPVGSRLWSQDLFEYALLDI